MNRAVKYISEFMRIVADMDTEAYTDTVGGLMRIFFETKYGGATLLLKLYRQSIHIVLIPRKSLYYVTEKSPNGLPNSTIRWTGI